MGSEFERVHMQITLQLKAENEKLMAKVKKIKNLLDEEEKN